MVYCETVAINIKVTFWEDEELLEGLKIDGKIH